MIPSRDMATRSLLAALCVALFIALRGARRGSAALRGRFLGAGAVRGAAGEVARSAQLCVVRCVQAQPADNYQFWRAQSPAWVYPLAGYFRVFGTDYPQLRIFSTLYAALGLGLLLWIAADLMRPAVWLFVGLLLVLDPIYFHTARVGFLEPAVGSWLALSMLALLRAERDVRWLCLSLGAFALAFFTKQAAVYAVPVVGIACGYRLLRADRKPRWLVLGAAALLCALSAFYIAHTDYVRTVTHNVDHVLGGGDWVERYRYQGVGSLLDRLLLPERRAHFFASLPISGPLALACCLGFGIQAVRRRKLTGYRELVLLGWLVCALLAMAVIAKSTLRFWTVAVPPAALIAGLGVEHALRAFEARGRSGVVRWLPLAVPLVALLGWSARGHALYVGDLRYSVRDGARQLQAQIGPRDATVVGVAAPGVVLGTPYRNFYLRGRFNAGRTAISRLGITHLLFRDRPDGTRNIIDRRFPRLLRELRPMYAMQVRGETLTLYDVEGRLRARRPRGKHRHKRRR